MSRPQQKHYVTRTLKIQEMVCPNCEAIVEDGVRALDGVKDVAAQWEKGQVRVIYDLLQLRLQAVEKLLQEIGYPPNEGYWQRKKRAWFHFTEKNERDNLTHVPHCCSKPPAGV
uniref:HMA domain-containing protein n=1 Tax=Magnetococcus massalia (strain MO-1) TaxID=451514 RepID=A0A1S7LIY8_MAGMO|nr:conserved protein of unknown function, containing HMA, heavy metal-associated domain [Candidatus Magnetococcus massalia]